MKLWIKLIAYSGLILLSSAVYAESTIYFVHSDHLGTPQVLTDKDQNVVWRAEEQLPFGEVSASGSVKQPIRFPGQYADEETGYYYNYYRDYDPTLGRYIQSDPIGLLGGLNTYAYSGGNPIMNIDPLGLNWFRVLPRNVQNAIRNLPEAAQNKWRNTPQVPKSRSNRHKNKSADDVPTWARGKRPTNGEDGKGFARRLCDDKYGPGNYETGPKSPYNQIKKWGDRDFERTPLPQPTNNFNYPGSPLFDPTTYDPWHNPYEI